MKKVFKWSLAFIMGLMTVTSVSAQMQEPQPLPVDQNVRTGVLPNGLTYYIRHNETPKGQADFYIAQKVGSILEEENQRGLAHFLEHMCFNGTKNFPEKGIINWLESIGVKFGYNLNAYTSVDETVYNISSVPVARQSVQDSCLLILHDWACDLTLDPKEIDAERGVIHEEWRRSNVGNMRIIEEQLPKIYPNNKYGQRLPIGIMEVVDNFPPQAIIDYYHTWYRPDQQGIIVVGDIDVDYIEGKIKDIFGPIKMPENAKERYYVQVEDTPGTIYAIGKDAEQTAPVALFMFKNDPLIPEEYKNTQAYFPVKYMTDVITLMLNNRLSDIANTPDSPFAMADVEISNFFLAKTKDAVTLQIIGKGGDITPAIQAVYRELLRALRGGFTQSELERANAEIRSNYQKLYDSRNNTPNESYAREYVRAFVEKEPIPGIEMEKQMMDIFTQAIPLEGINQLLPELIKADNRVLLLMLPDAEGFTIPTEESLAAAIASVDAETIEPYKEEVKTEPLIPSLPTPGKIVSEKALPQWDATEYTLSNGVKVIVKPTTFKENEIVFNSFAKGGFSTVPDALAPTLTFLKYAMSSNGYGSYTNSDLKKYLQGKQVSLNIDLGPFDRDITGSTTKADIGTLMELIYAAFTEYTIYPDEFAAAQNMIKSILANQEATPDYAFGKLITENLYKAPGAAMLSTAAIDAADCNATVAIVKALLSNAADYTFVFTGNIDMETFKPLMEQYLATLPANATELSELGHNAAYEFDTEAKTINESMAMSTPQTWAAIIINGKMPYSVKDKQIASMAAQIMSNRLLTKVREEMGATYSIGAHGNMSRIRENNVVYEIAFPMKPEMTDEVLKAIDTIIVEMTQNVTDAELNPVKEYMVKNATAALEKNEDWGSAIAVDTAINDGFDTFMGHNTETLNSVTKEDVMNFFKEVLNQNYRKTILLAPTAE